jgi:hypothetical protein
MMRPRGSGVIPALLMHLSCCVAVCIIAQVARSRLMICCSRSVVLAVVLLASALIACLHECSDAVVVVSHRQSPS